MSSLSAAPYVPTPPRPLTRSEAETLVRVADALIPDGPGVPRPSGVPDFLRWVDRALAARRDLFDRVTATLARLAPVPPEELRAELRRWSDDRTSGFDDLAAIVAGAYLLAPEVRRAVGYPGQGPRPAPFDEAAEQLGDGILDPVLERGPIHRLVGAPSAPLI